jgi:hypothetical protein
LQPQTEVFGGYNTEMFPRRTGLTFDPVSAASVAADVTIAALLNHERAARLVEFHARDAKNPSLQDVITAIGDRLRTTMRAETPASLAQRAAQSAFAMRLMELGANEAAAADVRAIAQVFVARLPSLLNVPGQSAVTPEWAAHRAALLRDVERYAARPFSPYTPQKPLATPAGDPIGGM